MARRVLGGVTADIGGEDSNEARSTFDRLLREYFATVFVSALPATREERHSSEPPSDTRNNRSRRPVT
jgi:hypothetical protein